MDFQARVIKQYKNLEELFKLNDMVTIQPQYYTSDTVLCEEWRRLKEWNNPKAGYHVIAPAVVASAGSYKDYNVLVNGEVYPESTIRNLIGNAPLSKIFKRV